MRTSKWFLRTHPKPKATHRLFCFPYAGGSAGAFTSWEGLLPDDVELVAIQPPGQGSRFGESLMTSIEAMGADVARAIPPWLDRPYLVYGHSLGAIVSFEMLHALSTTRLPMPLRYFCAARRAPQLAPCSPPIHDLPLDRFKAELRSLNGTPEAVLQNADLMAIFAPILRADLKAAYEYGRAPQVQLDCDVSVFSGAGDDSAAPEEAHAWQAHFSKAANFRVFPGGHFFIKESRRLVVEAVCESLPATTGSCIEVCR